MGNERASIPTKCIDQMPQPMDTAPPTSQSRALGLFLLLATRDDRFSAVCETNTATAIDRRTSHGLYTPAMGRKVPFRRPNPGRSSGIGNIAPHFRDRCHPISQIKLAPLGRLSE